MYSTILTTHYIWKLTKVKTNRHIKFVELCRTVTTDGNIPNQATEVKMTMHVGFVELCTAVTADGDISNHLTEVKMVVHIRFVELCTAVTADGDISNQATKVKTAMHTGFVELCMAVSYCWWWYFQSGDRSKNDHAYRICINYATGNCCILQTNYFEFQLALNKTLLHAIATHLLTNNTLPAPQKTKLDILHLPSFLFDKEFTISKLISFPASPPCLLGNNHWSPEWESALLPIFGSSRELNQDFCSQSLLPQPLCYWHLLHPPSSLGRTSAGPKKDFAPCHCSTHPPTNNTLQYQPC